MVVMAEEGRGGAASWGDLNYYLGRRLSLAISSADDPILYLAGALPKNLSSGKDTFFAVLERKTRIDADFRVEPE
jgi:hypothetical protein